MASLSGLSWIKDADPLCQAAGCQLLEARQAVAMAQRIGEVGQRMEVEDVALWCGIGGHAFSARDPGRQRVTVQQWDEDSHEMRPVTVSACGDHARPVQMQTRPKAAINGGEPVTDPAEARRRGYDPEYVAWLERKNGLPDGSENA